MPLISIIIPCHNSATYIKNALNSLSVQEFKDYEVIAIDDTSSDNAKEALENYRNISRMNLNIIVNEKNLGPGGSRNRAIEVARGEYLAFIDSDDTVEPTYFENILSEINKGADLINIGYNMVMGASKKAVHETLLKSKEEWIALTTGALWRIISKKDIWEGLTIPSITNAEDIAVIPLLFLRANHISNIATPLYNYVYSASSLSSKRDPRVVDNFHISYNYTKELYPKTVYQSSLEFHGIKTILYGATLNAIKAGLSNKEVLKIISEFERDWPNWYLNPFIKHYRGRKKKYLFLVKKHSVWGIRLFVSFHDLYLKIKG